MIVETKEESLTPTQPLTKAQTEALYGQARKASVLLKALSHETRFMILCLLSDGEKSVSEIEAILNLPQATVSQQLARLRMDDLVANRRDGRAIYYRLANSDVTTIVVALHKVFCEPALLDIELKNQIDHT